MPKDKESKSKEIVAVEEGSVPDFSHILQSKDLSLEDKRRRVLEELKMRKPRRKYASPAERKEAAKKRRDKRKAERVKVLDRYGIAPKKKGPKMSKAERKRRRSKRGKEKRGFLREMARENPELAKTYGIDVSRFKL